MGSSIQEIYNKFKPVLEDDSFFYAILLLLIAISSFGLGRLSIQEKQAEMTLKPIVTLQQKALVNSAADSSDISAQSPESGGAEAAVLYVASKSGTKYHLPWCPGAQQIKEENLISFATKAQALASGYTPAANCKGI